MVGNQALKQKFGRKAFAQFDKSLGLLFPRLPGESKTA
jgi:hypothetical protein